MKIHTEFKQQSPEWFEIRLGRVGGSDGVALSVNGKDGLGVGAKTLLYRKAAEIITRETENGFVSAAMERGTELEPFARQQYENDRFEMVQQVGYISMGSYFGYSPDGLVGDDGMIEIKCPGAVDFVRFSDTHEVQSNHYGQMQSALFLTDREWCDYVVFHPDFAPNHLVVIPVFPDQAMHDTFHKNIKLFESELNRVVSKLTAKK